MAPPARGRPGGAGAAFSRRRAPGASAAVLAGARLGGPHSVVFGGFSAEALNTRIADAQAKLVITSDGGYRRGSPSALKPAVDAALDHADTSVQKLSLIHLRRCRRAI